MDSTRVATIPLFAELSLDHRDRVAGLCKELSVEAGATLLREGDFGYAMFAITAGTAVVVQNETVIRTLVPEMSSGRSRCFPAAAEPQRSSRRHRWSS